MTRDRWITIRLNAEEERQLKELAAKFMRTKSDMLRRVLQEATKDDAWPHVKVHEWPGGEE